MCNCSFLSIFLLDRQCVSFFSLLLLVKHAFFLHLYVFLVCGAVCALCSFFFFSPNGHLERRATLCYCEASSSNCDGQKKRVKKKTKKEETVREGE